MPSDEELLRQIISRRQKKKGNPILVILLFIGSIIFSISIYGLKQDPIRNPKITNGAPVQIIKTSAPENISRQNQTGPTRTLLPTSPNYQATNQVLEATQQALNKKMREATAQAAYYEIMLVKHEVENKIEDLEYQQEISHTGTAQALDLQITQTQMSIEKDKQSAELKIALERDNLETEKAKNAADIERYNKLRNMGINILLIGIAIATGLFLVFLGYILRKAYQQQKWEMDRAAEIAKKEKYHEMADTVKTILENKIAEKDLIEKLVYAINKAGKIDDYFVPRFDKLQNHISQPERKKAVDLLVKYSRCDPVEQGKPTRLRQGTFRDLLDDINNGLFPPTNKAHAHLENTYLQQSTPINRNQQESTVRKIATGVYIGNNS